ncbi:hypothetical protein QBC34DRAFT_411437 [Podospora aff. communis PSN243]|uniref:Uncharacterized protein n=1 Tax=Podospora aff. communis PSN243 TaxID=3040156 RepID=A0AAV9GGY1_9PEZI|nr:hypothetical protein QBC34DRAFT_411437 [Podospora aff. communis PSN243]
MSRSIRRFRLSRTLLSWVCRLCVSLPVDSREVYAVVYTVLTDGNGPIFERRWDADQNRGGDSMDLTRALYEKKFIVLGALLALYTKA